MRWLLLLIAALLPCTARAQDTPSATEAQRDEARSHFELGLSHFDREEWQAALVEFLMSRDLYPSRGNTKDAAICLRKVGRFDEALDMYEVLLRDFPDLPAADQTLARREIADLQASVATLTLEGAPDGAAVTIDGIDRGKAPLPPVRLSAGTHIVRVTIEGSLPFEQRVDLAGRQAARLRARLIALTRAGRLRVTERRGSVMAVVVDGANVGQTPWEGALAPGPHTVILKGTGGMGTPPTLVTVKLDEITLTDPEATPLDSSIRVTVSPASASAFVDGVLVGRGFWAGRLRSGPHRVSATLEGYVPFARDVTLADGVSELVALSLEPLVQGRSGVVLELDAAAAVGVLDGADLAGALCGGGCSSSIPFGAEGVVHASYQLKGGLGLGLHAGYLLRGSSVDGRATQMTSGTLHESGTAHDGVLLNGFLAGIDGHYRTRGGWPFTVRLGLGAFIGNVRDHRVAALTSQNNPAPFGVDTTQSPLAGYLDIAPEVRIGRKLGDHVEIDVGFTVHVLASVTAVPRWDGTQPSPTGHDGEGVFGADSLAGPVLVVLAPGLGLTYEF